MISEWMKVMLDEIARNLEIYISFQQRHAHFAQGIGHIAFGNPSETAQILESLLQFTG